MGKSSSKQIVIAGATTLVVGAFGVGAFALAQANPNFDPQDFASAYSRGYEDAAKGYKANPIDTDGQANRNKDNAENDDAATEGQRDSQDAFSDTPQEGPSGTTAYNVTGNVEQGGITIANNAAGAGGGAGNANASSGPVIAPAGGSEGGNSNAGNNGNNGGNSGNQGGSTGGNTDPSPTPTPWQPSYTDPVEPTFSSDPVPDRKPDFGMDSDPINDSNKKLDSINRDFISITIMPTTTSEYQLYAGQTLDDWTVFCSIEAYFSYLDDNFDIQTAEWRCSKEQFSDYSKRYFKIVSRPDIAPSEDFPIEVAYRISESDEWTYETVTCTPAPSRTYILSTTLDKDGNSDILFSYPNSDINLFSCNHALMSATGYLQNNKTLTHLLLSWQEYGKDVDFFYQPTPYGRHLITPGRFVDIPDGYTMKLKSVWMSPDYSGAPESGSKTCSLQTLTGVSPSATCMLVPDRYGRTTLTTTPGMQAINIEAEPVTIDRLEVSDTVWYINMSSGLLRVNDGYSVTDGNPNYASLGNGILVNKKETEYLGIPLSFKTLDVPAGIESVNFTTGNNLERVTLNAAHAGEIPAGNWDNLRNCNILVDDEIFDAFSTANKDVFDISTGNTISMKSDPQTKYYYSNDTLISNDKAVHFVDTGVDLVRVANAHTLTAGCLENCPNIATLVLTDDEPYFLENGCLAGSNVRTIVCSTDEQVGYVRGRLQAAGADEDVYVTRAVTTDEGYRFFDNIDHLGMPATTVFEVPDTTRTFNGVGKVEGHPLAFSTIAPATFENHPAIAWVDLANSIDHIGANAFAGCSQLQGVFISNENAVTVGENAFANCASMRFIASNAMTGNFASDEKPNDSCLMYAPTNCDGYHANFTSFTPQSNVAEYAVDEQDDGSLVLSGCNPEGSRWLLLAAGGNINGDIRLSTDVVEIFSNAFADTKGDFTINWTELENLRYIDDHAFARSSVSGDVYFGSIWANQAALDDYAFSSCPNITSFTSETSWLTIGTLAFENCTGLEQATIGAMGDNNNAILPGLFSNCNNLRDLTFTGWSPVQLTMYGTGLPFLFNSESTYEEEEASLRLHVPDYAQDTYLENWLYAMLGTTDYKTYYNTVYRQLLKENDDVVPSDYQIKERMSEGMLKAENHLRTMMGMPLVDHSSFLNVKECDGYVYELQNGVFMLTGAPDDATVVDFNDIIPEGVATVGIDINAFSTCKHLERIVLTDKVSIINQNAFIGCDDVTVELPETVSAKLNGGLYYQPFTFGANIKLVVPEDAVTDYLNAWTRQCLGIANESKDCMDAYATNIMFDKWDVFFGVVPTADELNKAVNTPLMEQENYLRGLMGLDAIGSFDEMCCYYDASGLLDIYQPEPNPWPDWPDLPDLPNWNDDADAATEDAEADNNDADAATSKTDEALEASEVAEAERPDGVADKPANLAADAREGLAVKQSASLTEASALPVFS